MNENNSIEAIDKTNLTNQIKFWLDEISKIENYFIEEINQRKSYSKELSKYVAAFDYIDQGLIVLSATSGGISIISVTSIVVQFLLYFFSLRTGIVKTLLNVTRKEKKKHDKILMLAKSRLNSIETLVSQGLIDMEKSHEEFIAILKEKDNMRRQKTI